MASKNYHYKNTNNKTGEYQAHLPEGVTKRLNAYCKKMNLNRQDYVIKAVQNQLRNDLEEYFSGLVKEDLITMLLDKESEE